MNHATSDGGTDETALGPVEQQVLDALDLEGMLSCLTELVAIRSLPGRETPAQEFVAERMETIGLDVDAWTIDFDELRRHPAYGADVPRDEGLGVVGSAGRGVGPTLILNGHVDVVPAGEQSRWSHPPWRVTVSGGRVHGRGVADTKGGLCAALFAAKAILDADVRLEGSLQLQSVIGEEDGGTGTLATLLRGHRGDGAIVLEPTRLAVAPAQAGALTFRVAVPGMAAHGALREEGVDPVEKFSLLHRRIRELERERNREVGDPLFAHLRLPFAITVGKVWAGEWASTVADRLVFEGRLGVAPGEKPSSAQRAFEEAISEAAAGDMWLREHPPVLEWPGAQFEPARTPVDSAVVATLRAACRAVRGEPPQVRGMPYGADMRLLVNEGGIPTVLFGPGDVREAHRPDEGVEVDELVEAARILAVAALRFCGVEES